MKRILLDESLADKLGDDAWHGVAWCYENELPEKPLATYKKLSLPTFAREMTLLAAHFNRDISDPLMEKYFAIVSERLSEEKFLEAANAAYGEDLHWAKLIAFLVNFHQNQAVPAQEAYKPFTADAIAIHVEKAMNK